MWVWCIRAQVLYAWLCAHTCVYVCAWDTRSDGSEWGVGGGQQEISNSWGNARGGGGRGQGCLQKQYDDIGAHGTIYVM